MAHSCHPFVTSLAPVTPLCDRLSNYNLANYNLANYIQAQYIQGKTTWLTKPD